MNAVQLLAHFHRIGDAPDAVPRLRRFILHLAVRGKLVTQDENDEPAADLLRRVLAGRSRAVEEGRFRERPLLPGVDPEDWPFSIPRSWCWTRFGNVVDFSAGRTPSRSDPSFWNNGDHAWVSIADMKDGQTLTVTKESVSDTARQRVFGTSPEPLGTILMSFKLTIGKIVRLGVPAFHNEAIISVRPHVAEFDQYLFIVLPQFAREGEAKGAIKGATLNRESISNILLPVPPLAEQNRIVAKVDELMALCDQLEAGRAECEVRRGRLAAASLARLNAPDHDPTTFANHARFALSNFAALTTRPAQIKQLRQTIVNLAVRGKLVPQNPSETVAPRGLKRDETDDRLRDDLPTTWREASLSAILMEETRNGYSRKPDDAPDGTPILRISAGTLRPDGIVAEEQHKLISGIDAKTRRKYGLERGDLLACRFNGNKTFVGRLTLFDDSLGLAPIYPDKLIRIRVNPELALPKFVRLAGDADLVRRQVEAACATTVGNWGISATSLKEVRFPLPPLAEQHRIVARVDELMSLCGRLEARIADGDGGRQRLLDALLGEARGLTSQIAPDQVEPLMANA